MVCGRALADEPASEPDWTEEQMQAAIAEVSQDKDARWGVGSAAICFFTGARQRALDEIKKQKKYEQLGGVRNNVALLMIQNGIRRCDEGIETARAVIGKRKPAPCTDKKVAAMAKCFRQLVGASSLPPSCTRIMVRFAFTLVPQLDWSN